MKAAVFTDATVGQVGLPDNVGPMSGGFGGLGRLPQELPESGKVFPFPLIRVQGNLVPFLPRQHLNPTEN